MKMQKLIITIFTCFLVLTLAACTHHRRPAAVVDGNRLHANEGVETYTEGVGKDGSYAENGKPLPAKCFPAKAIPGAEQRYFFDFDSFAVRDEFMDSLKMQADYLLKHQNAKARLEGNADDRGSREYNVALGWRRAQAVMDVLKQYGVSASQVTLMSYGAEKPVVAGDDEKSYQCNRRVDLKYTSD